MLQAMYNGVSAIGATQTNMDVIGNNIANVNTDGFKASRLSFASQLADTINAGTAPSASVGGTNPQQIGLGVRVGSIDMNAAQGALTSTAAPTDMAINGNGYFQIANAAGAIEFTRDGHFALDSSGQLVQADTGEPVLGWTATSGGVINNTQNISAASVLKIGVGGLTSARATSGATFAGNLSADAAAGGTYNRSVNVFDSQGVSHVLTVTFTRGSDGNTPPGPTNIWNWTASGDPGLGTPSGTTNQGTVSFDSSGNYTGVTGSIVLNPVSTAAQNQAISLDFKALTEFSGPNTVSPTGQDGFAPGTLQSFSVDANGVINGTFANGQTGVLGQIALASFSNPAGLIAIGSNKFLPSQNSGQPRTAAANTTGLGEIQTSYLEQSNVDLGTEFTNMIIAQRSFQANTKIVTAVDQMLNELIQMKQ